MKKNPKKSSKTPNPTNKPDSEIEWKKNENGAEYIETDDGYLRFKGAVIDPSKQITYNFPLSGKVTESVVALSGTFNFVEDEPEVKEVPELIPVSATPDFGGDECKHDFLVTDHDNDGNVYWCKICDSRWKRHPSHIKKELEEAAKAAVARGDVISSIQKFRDGAMTFTKAAEKTRFSVEEIMEVMRQMYPPDIEREYMTHETIGGEKEEVLLSEKPTPQRTSSPADIEALFGNGDVTLTDLQAVMKADGVFSDIVGFNQWRDEKANKMIAIVDFVDGSKQRIEVSELITHLRPQQVSWNERELSVDEEALRKIINDDSIRRMRDDIMKSMMIPREMM